MLLCGMAGTAAAIVALDHQSDDDVTGLCAKVAMTSALGMPLFFSLRMLRERAQSLARAPIEAVGLPLLAGWFLTLPHRPFEGPGIVPIRWMLLLAALHFFAAVSPFARGREGIGFWQFNRRIFLRFCLSTLYAGVLTAGLELALLSADKLFELKLGNSYTDLFFIMAGCFHPVFFLAGVPRDFTALELDREHPRGLKAFTQFALAPLVAVYTAILYAYAFKIVAAHSWPHGWVALPVLILSGVGILSALLLHPLRADAQQKWAGWFCRNFPRALAPLSLLLLLSVWERIRTYGVTEERYLGIVAGGWVLAWATVFILKKTAGIRWVPGSLALICLLAAFGPLSAGTISKNSQLGRLTRLLQAHGLMADGKATAPREVTTLPREEYDDMRSTIQYLMEMHGAEAIRGLFGGLFNEADWKYLSQWKSGDQILKKLNLAGGSVAEGSTWYSLDSNKVATAEGFKRVSYLQFSFGAPSPWKTARKQAGSLFIGVVDGILKTADTPDAPPQPVPLDAFLKSLSDNVENTLPQERMTADWEHNGHAFRFIFANIYLNRKPGEPDGISSCTFLLLEK